MHFQETSLLELILSLSEKGMYSMRKEFALKGKKFLSFRVDPISDGIWCAG